MTTVSFLPAPAPVKASAVLEHTPEMAAAEAFSLLRPNGRLLFSAFLMDAVQPQTTDHWSIAPRNGHISLHTSASLQSYFGRFGWIVRSFNGNLHLAEHP